jgi:TolB-like protein
VPFGGVTRAGFASRPLADRQTVLYVQAGRWRIAAERIAVTIGVAGADPAGADDVQLRVEPTRA